MVFGNWANVNTVVSQGIGSPEERESDGGGVMQVFGAVKTHITLVNQAYSFIWTWLVTSPNNDNSNIKDSLIANHHKRYNNNNNKVGNFKRITKTGT